MPPPLTLEATTMMKARTPAQNKRRRTTQLRRATWTLPASVTVLAFAVAVFVSLPSSEALLSQTKDQRGIFVSKSLNSAPSLILTSPKATTHLCMKPLSREDEIRRKIMRLKRQGKIKEDGSGGTGANPNPGSVASYEQRIKQKLGKKKSKLLGIEFDDDDDDEIFAEVDRDDDEEGDQADLSKDTPLEDVKPAPTVAADVSPPRGRIGALPDLQQKNEERAASIASELAASFADDDLSRPMPPSADIEGQRQPIINPELFETSDGDAREPEMSDEELAEIVAEKMAEKRRLQEEEKKLTAQLRREEAAKQKEQAAATTTTATKQTTSGVGGAWSKEDADESSEDYYKPKSGSWGAFPRPRNISTAYGGGRRIGAGYSKEEKDEADLKTKERLRNYRIKVGIEVPTETEHAKEIEEALYIGQVAMQRGVYATAVSALEKVTPWCSTNSKVGSKVFLELAMAYEAVGRTQEAYQVYNTLSTCRMEDVKYNAKRLLYGMEAMQVMKEVSKDFSRKKIKNTFMDATGLDNFVSNFDDRYQTAYIDLNSGYYKRLTESVVRSNREARQILLKATGKGEVGRLRIVQALRSMSRHFDDALEAELESNEVVEPTAMMNGKPILKPKQINARIALDEFALASPEQIVENLRGTWRLQLLADRKGDGVSFYNTTDAVQVFDVDGMTFEASGQSGFVPVSQSGEIEIDGTRRILTRKNAQSTGGGILSLFGGKSSFGFAGAVLVPQQIISVDSILLVTKRVLGKRRNDKDADKEFFAVWRKQDEESSFS